tara:strand:- start:1122 stop:2237 length:1116 start_codon:yes stop_codon:yes gene_type:complete
MLSQNNKGKTDDFGRIALQTVVPENSEAPAAAARILKNKMTQITTKNGLSSLGNRFTMYPQIDILTQDITSSAPPMHAYTLSVTMYISDLETQTIFSSTNLTLKGVGKNETKAYISALKMLNGNRPEIKGFVEEGKNKIIEYYNSQCDFILKDATAAASRKEYDKAIYELLLVPDVCKDCYMKALDLTSDIYMQKLNNECQEMLAKARVAKSNDKYEEAATHLSPILPDVECYADAQSLLKEIEDHKCSVSLGKAKGAWANRNSKEASKALSEISFDSNCYKEAKNLANEIASKLDEREKRDWDLAYEKYNRNQQMVENSAKQDIEDRQRANDFRDKNEVALTKMKLDAAKDIAKSLAKKKPNTTNLIFRK